ncbi:zinc finger protein RFP-like [Anolis sagrei]|uniref:zinc finger protein RFP-like n=1 Tax=Anolis sagrei TaxID=38937 RepID=UPI003522DF11
MEAALGDPVQELCEESTCSVCLDYFRDPVTIECGHNFCRGCIAQFSGESDQVPTCPQCRKPFLQKNFVSNKQLANFVEITKKLTPLVGKRALATEIACKKHQEPFKLFCKDDEIPICVVCDRSRAHRNHAVVPAEEAAQKYKKLMKTEREKTEVNFRQLYQILEAQKKLLLAQMERVVEEITSERDAVLSKVSKELSSLENCVREMELKCQQPQTHLLQDVRNISLSTKEKNAFENPVAFPPKLKWKIWDCCDVNSFLVGIMNQFGDALISGQKWQKANITLDPDTAHPQLILSRAHKSVRWGEEWQTLPQKAERFEEKYIVLGREGFTTGRHFWDISVGKEEEWAVGVARKSVERKGAIEFSPMGGIWEMGKWSGRYRAPNLNFDTLPSLDKEPKRIRVCLNSTGGQLVFYDADTATQIHTFLSPSFSRETLLPFFWVRKNGYLHIL